MNYINDINVLIALALFGEINLTGPGLFYENEG